MRLGQVEQYFGLDIDSFDEEKESTFVKLEKEVIGVLISPSRKIKKMANPEGSISAKIKRFFSGSLDQVEYEIFQGLFSEETKEFLRKGPKEKDSLEIHKAIVGDGGIAKPYEKHFIDKDKAEIYRLDEGTDFLGRKREYEDIVVNTEKYLEDWI